MHIHFVPADLPIVWKDRPRAETYMPADELSAFHLKGMLQKIGKIFHYPGVHLITRLKNMASEEDDIEIVRYHEKPTTVCLEALAPPFYYEGPRDWNRFVPLTMDFAYQALLQGGYQFDALRGVRPCYVRLMEDYDYRNGLNCASVAGIYQGKDIWLNDIAYRPWVKNRYVSWDVQTSYEVLPYTNGCGEKATRPVYSRFYCYGVMTA